MRRACLVTLAALSLAAPSLAQKRVKKIVPIHHETLSVLGWSRECSVAVTYRGFPFLGDAMVNEPVKARIGSLAIPPGKEYPEVDWLLSFDGVFSWNRFEAEDAEKQLKKEFPSPGWTERLRPDPVVDDQGLPELLLTTAAFQTKAADFPAPSEWRLDRVHYAPQASTCGFLVFRSLKAAGDAPFYAMRLVRIGNPAIRKDRARGHVANGLRLLERGDRTGALEETGVAASMAPDYGLARYHHAGQLALNGRTAEALVELAAAIALDSALKTKASGDKDFAHLSWMPRFQDLTR